MDGYKRLRHAEPVGYNDFYRSCKYAITKDEYERSLAMYEKNGCITMGTWISRVKQYRSWIIYKDFTKIRLTYAKTYDFRYINDICTG